MLESERIIEEIFEYYGNQRDKKEQSVIVQMLKELQEAEGCLTDELKSRAAQTAEVAPSLIDLLIRTYPSLKEAAYAHIITVCSGARCGSKGSRQILDQIRQELHIKKGHVSADGTCLLKMQNCLKECKTSPNFKIDGVLYSNVKPEEVTGILRKTLGSTK